VLIHDVLPHYLNKFLHSLIFLVNNVSKKSGGYCSTAKAPGLKPCSVGSRSHNAIGNCNPVIKATKNGGSHPTVSFTPALVLMTKEKNHFKSGRMALPIH
jgi:hypothetical protein